MKFIILATKFVISNRAAPGYKLQYDIPIFTTILLLPLSAVFICLYKFYKTI